MNIEGKTQVVALWGLGLVLFQEWASGDLAALWQEIISGTSTRPGGMLVRMFGQVLFIVIISVLAEIDDAMANLALLLLAGLTLVYLMDNSNTVNGIIGKILGWSQSANAPTTFHPLSSQKKPTPLRKTGGTIL
jgi:hypothetical protein